jgi:hypothetical protein
LAIKPDDQDTFLREVDEELRRDQLNQFVSRYGWHLLAAVLLVLAAIGGYIWWQGRQQAQREGEAETLLEALQKAEAGNRPAAAAKAAEIADSDADGYRVAALFMRASNEAESGNAAAAVATLKTMSDDEGLAEPYRQAALVRQTILEYDRLQPQQVIQRLGPLARPGQAWFGTAGEMVAMAHLRLRQNDRAAQLFARIARDESVPASIRTRAVQMAGSLGINAMPATSGGAPAAPAAPAVTRDEPE